MGRTSDARDRLIQSAMELISTRSYADVGVQELCRHAGVKKGSFYHFFPGKRDLVLAAIDQYWEFARTETWSKAFDATIPPLERIERFFDIVHQNCCMDKQINGQMRGCLFGNLAAEMSTKDELIRQKIDGIFQEIMGLIQSALNDAVALGDIPELDTHEAAQAIWAYWEGALLVAKSRQDPNLIRRLGKTMMQFLTARSAAA